MLFSGIECFEQSDSVIYMCMCAHTHTHTHTHIYIHLYSFSDSFPLQIITIYWIQFPVLYSRTLLCIYFMFDGGGLVIMLCLTLVIPWTVAHHVPLCMEFSRQDYWSGLPFPSPIKCIVMHICLSQMPNLPLPLFSLW